VRRLRSLTTSRIFRIQGEPGFLPSFLDQQRFYLTLDYHFLVAQMRSELAYIYDHWREPGRPTVTLMLTHAMFQLGHKPIYESPLLALMTGANGRPLRPCAGKCRPPAPADDDRRPGAH
jgi:phosphorylase kinase alpha/beta subunit